MTQQISDVVRYEGAEYELLSAEPWPFDPTRYGLHPVKIRYTYFSEWAGGILFSRDSRRAGIPCPDSNPPENYTPEDVEFALKLVAHWEGGPDPCDPAAVPVELVLNVPPLKSRLILCPDDEL